MPLTGPTPSYDPENPEEAPKAPDEERQHEDEAQIQEPAQPPTLLPEKETGAGKRRLVR
jgi:hypothetical protein